MSNKNLGTSFENLIEATFQAYYDAGIARLMMMPVPSKQVGLKNGMPMFVRTGKAPFDVIGYLMRDASMVGAELKSSVRKNSLPIVAPTKKGDGVQFHQLDALAGLAQCGGVARLVWSNGGEFGVLKDEGILVAWRTYLHAMKSEESGKNVPLGSKSISWDSFVRTDYTNLYGVVGIDWLML